ncbi:MAG: P-loop NTPase fold protein [Anaerolineae bacterium]|nr:P-loop NTPase fold protein [Anaerolineae bacterium]
MRFVADEPIRRFEDDLFGFKEFVDLIEGAVRATEPPFVFGVLGDWGTGKTSVMRLLEARFRKPDGTLARFPDGREIFVPIWFDAWKYENDAHIVYPLLHTIKQQYEHDAPPEKRNRIVSSFNTVLATSLLAVGQVGLKAALRTLTGGAVEIETLEEALKRVREMQASSQALSEVTQVLSDWADNVSRFATAFEELLSTYARELVGERDAGRVRFLILVDDLDRCLPETTISILESIKHHLSVPRCIFVLAINGRVVYQTIRRKYGSEIIDGREYLEKILNYAFYVPEPTLNKGAMERFIDAQRQMLVGADRRRDFDAFSDVLVESNFNNPRRIKRILNRYLIYLESYSENNRGHLPDVICLMLIAEYFPTLFQLYTRLGKRASDEIKELLDGRTSVRNFSEKHGVNVELLLPQMRHMQRLFRLNSTEETVAEYVRRVFGLTRLF